MLAKTLSTLNLETFPKFILCQVRELGQEGGPKVLKPPALLTRQTLAEERLLLLSAYRSLTKMSSSSPWPTNAILVPLGEYVGEVSKARLLVNFLRSVPLGFMV
jgi:hypothetical protein